MRQLIVKPTVLLMACAIVTSSLVLTHATSLGDATSREGCMNQWLFDGVWRVEVTKVEPLMNGSQQNGWQVTEVWRNGTPGRLSPSDSWLKDQRLELSSGAITAKESTAGSMSQGGVAFNNFAPAGQFSYKQVFWSNNVDPANKPQGLEILFDAAKLAQNKSWPQFTSRQYNFHFKLGCVASGAASQAEGGSTQIAATEGCMNQWMSSGVWKMRATAIALAPGDFGWLVTQEWVNITRRAVFPGVLNGDNGRSVPTNVSDEYLTTQGGNTGSSFNAVGGLQLGSRNVAFPPGGSFTFKQLFAWSPFDKTDKPTRLLVTFDASAQNKLAGLPHYRSPASFRINLDCTK